MNSNMPLVRRCQSCVNITIFIAPPVDALDVFCPFWSFLRVQGMISSYPSALRRTASLHGFPFRSSTTKQNNPNSDLYPCGRLSLLPLSSTQSKSHITCSLTPRADVDYPSLGRDLRPPPTHRNPFPLVDQTRSKRSLAPLRFNVVTFSRFSTSQQQKEVCRICTDVFGISCTVGTGIRHAKLLH